MARNNPDEKAESPLMAVAAVLTLMLIMGALIWLVASNRIVHGSLKPAVWLAALWKIGDTEYGVAQWNQVVVGVTKFAVNPAKVGFPQWAAMVTVAFRPAMTIAMLLYLASLLFIVGKRRVFMRAFTAESLLAHASLHFTGVIPVLTLRKQIAKNKHPLWRRQVTPEEVFQRYKVPSGAPGASVAGAPMVQDGQFSREVARGYFMGFTSANTNSSTMLGRRVVDLVADSRRERSPVFCDRMSAEGKTLFGLWAAVAFGGAAGRDEYCIYRDKLNRSAYATKDGMANLVLAQPLYDKYRLHPLANKIFGIHHWEHTALFFLLSLAQRKGRFTTAEVLWLRPTNRIMFFALNSRGSFTPHTEAAATFSQFAFESLCAKQGRLPLVRDADGRIVPMIYVDKAIDALELEHRRWAEGTDDEDDWWLEVDAWKQTNAAVARSFEQAAAAVPAAAMPGFEGMDTEFDGQVRQQADRANVSEAQQAALDQLLGATGKT